jgi:hypothetical protein
LLAVTNKLSSKQNLRIYHLNSYRDRILNLTD